MQESDDMGPSNIGASYEVELPEVERKSSTDHYETSQIISDAYLGNMQIVEGNSTFSDTGELDGPLPFVHPHIVSDELPDFSILDSKIDSGENCFKEDILNVDMTHPNDLSEESYIFIERTQGKPLSQFEGTSSKDYLNSVSQIEAMEAGNVNKEGLVFTRNVTYSNFGLEPGSNNSAMSSEMWSNLCEELLLSYCVKNILDVQLSVQAEILRDREWQLSMQDNELYALRFALNDHQTKNAGITQDLSFSKSELEAVVCERENLNVKLLAAESEINAISMQANALQHSVEGYHIDISRLSQDLAGCKDVIATLETENGGLKEMLHLLSEERDKLIEEKGDCHNASDNLSNELANLKIFVASLEFEYSESRKQLASRIEERNKVSEEKDDLVIRHEQQASEISSLKDLVESLRNDYASLSEAFDSTNEEMKKLETQRKILVEENDRLSSNLLALSDQFLLYQKEQTWTSGPLNDPSGLPIEENVCIVKSLEMSKQDECHSNTDPTFGEIKAEYRVLVEDFDTITASSIEHIVLYEAIKSYAYCLKEKFDALCIVSVNEQYNQYEQVVSDLQEQLYKLQQSSNVMSIVFRDLADKIQNDASHIFTAAQRLDEFTGLSPTIDISSDARRHLCWSVNAISELIEDLSNKIRFGNEEEVNKLVEANKTCNDLVRQIDVSNEAMQNMLSELGKLLSDSGNSVSSTKPEVDNAHIPYSVENLTYKICAELKELLADRLNLQTLNSKLNVELVHKAQDFEHLDSCIRRIILDIESFMKLSDDRVENQGSPILCLSFLISEFMSSYERVNEELKGSKISCDVKEEELKVLLDKCNDLAGVNQKQEEKFLHIHEQLCQAEVSLNLVNSKLQEKESELYYSEQKVSSIRDKLGIAVAKGKGLVGQRDALKQSLTDTTNELEKCQQELDRKDSRLHELEDLVKSYMEAGERVEALESELSYIRNSATALRESFLLKDSVLLRIEEILEDINILEDFHSRDIIEKVDWLARLAKERPEHVAERDTNDSVRGTYVDVQSSVMNSEKDGAQPDNSSTVEWKKNFEELQRKYFLLAEQNEMLEQSLMHKSHLVQRCEEMLDSIAMPSHVHTLEPEERIEWLRDALTQAHTERNSLIHEIDELKNHSEMIGSHLDDSQSRMPVLGVELEAFQKGNNNFELEKKSIICLISEQEKLSLMVIEYEITVTILQNQLLCLDTELMVKNEIEDNLERVSVTVHRLNNSLSTVLQNTDNDVTVNGTGIDTLEIYVNKLLQYYLMTASNRQVLGEMSLEKHDGMLELEREDADEPRKRLEEVMAQLRNVEQERDAYAVVQQTLASEIESLKEREMQLQELLSLEEQRSNTLREKLNVAVRKGKSLVQQRDSLKQDAEEMTNKVAQLNAEIKHLGDVHAELEVKTRSLAIDSDKVGALESENVLLRTRLAETARYVQEKEHTLATILESIRDLDVGNEIVITDPFAKLEYIAKLRKNWLQAVGSLEEESRKARRSADLLLAELNEVQDRNDHLQEELITTTNQVSELFKEREIFLTLKNEALSQVDKLSKVHFEEKTKFNSELSTVKKSIMFLTNEVSDFHNLLNGYFSMDLEFLHNLEGGFQSCLERLEVERVCVPRFIVTSPPENEVEKKFSDFLTEDLPDRFDENITVGIYSSVQELVKDVVALKTMLQMHSVSLHELAEYLSKIFGEIQWKMTSVGMECVSLREELSRMKLAYEENKMEIESLQKKVCIMYEACSNSLAELDNVKCESVKERYDGSSVKSGLTLSRISDIPSEREDVLPSLEDIRCVADKFCLAVKTVVALNAELSASDGDEMKVTIANLQTELHEKDAHHERELEELVNQIKEGEGSARKYSIEVQSLKNQKSDLENQLCAAQKDRNNFERRVQELNDAKARNADLQGQIRSLNAVMISKEQEIEALIQALEEQEVLLEDCRCKAEQLEIALKQKNIDLDTLEASREKIAKKLSITVSKFDELHEFSEILLTEVEKLQLQLKDRDSEISFLRQEITRCTNDVLIASQMSNKRFSDELHEILGWLDVILSQDEVETSKLGGGKYASHEHEMIEQKMSSIVSELRNLRLGTKNKDMLLELEMHKVEELSHKVEILEIALTEKDSQLNSKEIRDLGGSSSVTSEIVELEPMTIKWNPPVPNASQVRSLRKSTNDQIAIAIDVDDDDRSRLNDEDDEKIHGFKSLTSSRIVPKFASRVSDTIDGLWVSCDRALMRQPAVRLAIMMYWAFLHTLLAALIF